MVTALLTDLNDDIETYNRYVIPVKEQRVGINRINIT
jgi:hypothetical protein